MQKRKRYYEIIALTVLKAPVVIMAIAIGLYPVCYFIFGRSFGLLARKDPYLFNAVLYNAAFYIHITGGGLALLIGWLQFSKKLRVARMTLHRTLGKIYVLSALLSAAAGIAIGFFADGGFVAQTGFISLGIVWLMTTRAAYLSVRRKNIPLHRAMMVYSYAACLAAVTLRVYMPLLSSFFHSAIIAYQAVAWLCWVPNIFIAWLYTNRMKRSE